MEYAFSTAEPEGRVGSTVAEGIEATAELVTDNLTAGVAGHATGLFMGGVMSPLGPVASGVGYTLGYGAGYIGYNLSGLNFGEIAGEWARTAVDSIGDSIDDPGSPPDIHSDEAYIDGP